MEFNAWQHFLTHAFYYCAVFIFPTPVSINILQLAIISLIVGYFVYCIYTVCGHSKIAAACAYIPFLLPNILLQDSFILRATVFDIWFCSYLPGIYLRHGSVKTSHCLPPCFSPLLPPWLAP